MWGWLVCAAATAGASYVYWRLLALHKRHMSMAMVAQQTGMRIAAWAIEASYAQADGLVSIEGVVTDNHGHDASIEIIRPSLVADAASAAAAGTTAGDFFRLNYAPGSTFKIEEARLRIRMHGQVYIVVLTNAMLRTLLSVVLDVVAAMTTCPDSTVDGLPVSASLMWVDTGRCHDVLPAVCPLAGPRARWWGGGGHLTVTAKTILSESLRLVYGLKTPHLILHHLADCEVRVSFASGRTLTIKSKDGPDVLCKTPFDPLDTSLDKYYGG